MMPISNTVQAKVCYLCLQETVVLIVAVLMLQ